MKTGSRGLCRGLFEQEAQEAIYKVGGSLVGVHALEVEPTAHHLRIMLASDRAVTRAL